MTIVEHDIKTDHSLEIQEERQTIVHCRINVSEEDLLIRIWRSTYLRDNGTNSIAKIITAYNITFHPIWTPARPNHKFTLIFEGLNKSCRSFDLVEDIPQSGGFFVPRIPRNGTDVYSIIV